MVDEVWDYLSRETMVGAGMYSCTRKGLVPNNLLHELQSRSQKEVLAC